MTKFIVGKKYKHCHDLSIVVTCVGFTTRGCPLVEYPHGSIEKALHPEDWTEVREPRDFWIVREHSMTSEDIIFDSKSDAERVITTDKIIHVREVLDGG